MTLFLKCISQKEPPLWFAQGIIGRLTDNLVKTIPKDLEILTAPTLPNKIIQIFKFKVVAETEIVYTYKSFGKPAKDILTFRLANGKAVPKNRGIEFKQCHYW